MADEIKVVLSAEDKASAVLERFERQIQQSGQSVGGLGHILGGLGGQFGLATAGATGAVGAFSALAVGAFKLGEELDNAGDRIQIMTGAVGESLKGLQADFNAVASSVPASFQQTATVIGELNTRLDLTGPSLQGLSRQLLEMSRLTGTDLASNTRLFSRYIQDWQLPVSQAGDELDRLFVISQKTGVSVGDLSSLLVQFGAPLRQVGFSAQEAAALLGQFEKQGVNTAQVTTSLRIAIGELLEKGITDIPTAFRDAIAAIENAGSVAEGNALAFEIFGRRAGADMAEAIRQGRFSLGEFNETLGETRGTVLETAARTEDAAERMAKAINKVKIALEAPATGVFGAAATGAESLAAILEQFDPARRQELMFAQYQTLADAGSPGAAIVAQQFERQFGMTVEYLAEYKRIIAEAEEAGRAARERAGQEWDRLAQQAETTAPRLAEPFRAIDHSINDLAAATRGATFDLKDALSNAVTQADVQRLLEFEAANQEIARAIREVDTATAAAILTLQNLGDVEAATAAASRALGEQTERKRAVREAEAAATRAATDAERAHERALRDAARAAEAAHRDSPQGRLEGMLAAMTGAQNQRVAEQMFEDLAIRQAGAWGDALMAALQGPEGAKVQQALRAGLQAWEIPAVQQAYDAGNRIAAALAEGMSQPPKTGISRSYSIGASERGGPMFGFVGPHATDMLAAMTRDARQMGAALSQGIAVGAITAAPDAMKETAAALTGQIQQELRIHSPSQKWAKEVGVPSGQGWALGVVEGFGTEWRNSFQQIETQVLNSATGLTRALERTVANIGIRGDLTPVFPDSPTGWNTGPRGAPYGIGLMRIGPGFLQPNYNPGMTLAEQLAGRSLGGSFAGTSAGPKGGGKGGGGYADTGTGPKGSGDQALADYFNRLTTYYDAMYGGKADGAYGTIGGGGGRYLVGNPLGSHMIFDTVKEDMDEVGKALLAATLQRTDESMAKLAQSLQRGEMLITQSLTALATDFRLFGSDLQLASAAQAQAGARSSMAAALGAVDNSPGSTTGSYINLLTQYGWFTGGRAAGPMSGGGGAGGSVTVVQNIIGALTPADTRMLADQTAEDMARAMKSRGLR